MEPKPGCHLEVGLCIPERIQLSQASLNMEVSVGSAVAAAMQAKANVQHSEIAVALAAKQLDSQKVVGDAISQMLEASQPPAGSPGHVVNILA